MPRRRYPSDLTDAQWARLEPSLPAVRPGGRPRAHPLREVIDALRSMLRGGIAWRALPHDYPPWQTVYHSFRAWRLDAWRLDGTWERLNDELRVLVRERAGRNAQPSAGILDSQSAKTTAKGGLAATTEPRN
jgi:putative transposase